MVFTTCLIFQYIGAYHLRMINTPSHHPARDWDIAGSEKCLVHVGLKSGDDSLSSCCTKHNRRSFKTLPSVVVGLRRVL